MAKKNIPFDVIGSGKTLPGLRRKEERNWDTDKIASVLKTHSPKTIFDAIDESGYLESNDINDLLGVKGSKIHHFNNRDKMVPRLDPLSRVEQIGENKWRRKIDTDYYNWVKKNNYHRGPIDLTKLYTDTINHIRDNDGTSDEFKTENIQMLKQMHNVAADSKGQQTSLPPVLAGMMTTLHPEGHNLKKLFEDRHPVKFTMVSKNNKTFQ